ncbi:MAG: 3-deoxy-D-manno-octulosonic acid transferase [Alphaproteobacteria bacterium]|nr:3-deoxy-D-manno-octulosonic acid transferase [Alphaproteobacteria bacterium]
MLTLYRLVSSAAAPLLRSLLKRRLAAGKEDPARLTERRGVASVDRPKGSVIWIHAASVGEMNSSMPLIAQLARRDPNATVLLTTGTMTSAKLAASRFEGGVDGLRVIHQMAPLDHPRWCARFLAHWRPDAALFIESELWPNLILESKARQVLMALVNARLSKRSGARWRRFASAGARRLLSCFAVILCQDEATRTTMTALGAANAQFMGNLKMAAPPLEADPALVGALRAMIAERPVFLAASTHPEDDELVFDAFRRLHADRPETLLIVAPRHPARGAALARLSEAAGWRTCLKSQDGLRDAGLPIDVLISDTMGELGAYYSIARMAYLGGGMADRGGHNPVEAVQLDCRVVYGPDRANFQSVSAALEAHGQARVVRDSAEIAQAVTAAFEDDVTPTGLGVAAAEAEALLQRIMTALDPVLPKAAGDG